MGTINTLSNACESLVATCNVQSSATGEAINDIKTGTSLSAKRELAGVALMSAIASLGATGCCCGKKEELNCDDDPFFDCDNASLHDPNEQDYATEYDQPSTPGGTAEVAEIKRDFNNFLDEAGPHAIHGAGTLGLMSLPIITMAVITQGKAGKVGEGIGEAALLSVLGGLMIALQQAFAKEDNYWLAPIVLTTFVPAVISLISSVSDKMRFVKIPSVVLAEVVAIGVFLLSLAMD